MAKSKATKEISDAPVASTSAIAMDVDTPTPETTTVEPVKKEKSKKRKRAAEVEGEATETSVAAASDEPMTMEELQAETSAKGGKGPLPDELEIDLKAPTPLSKAEARQAKRDAKKAKKEGNEDKKDGSDDEDSADKTTTDDPSTSEPAAKKPKKAKKDAGDPDDPPKPKRANSIWIGNLNFRSTADGLREWIIKMIVQGSTGVADIPPDASLVKALGKIKGGPEKAITRVNLPTKPGKGRGMIPEGKGFAYVDFASKELQTFALGLSEKVFGGRKVLIKLGDDHAPTPDARTPKPLSIIAGTLPPASKLGANPPSSSLFCGNLAFDTNEVELREHVEREVARARGMKVVEEGEEAEEDNDEPEGAADAEDEDEDEEASDAENDDEPGAEPSTTNRDPESTTTDPLPSTVQDILHGDQDQDPDQKGKDTKTTSKVSGLKKVRMPLFEDSGRCKGFAFLDFESPEFATFALAQRPLMFFKGRKLVLQYASEESTKRSLPAHKRNADKEKEASFGNTPSRGGFSSRGGRGGISRPFSGGDRKPYGSSGDAGGDGDGGETGESTFMKRPERKPRMDRPAFGAPGGAIGDDDDGRGAARGKKWEASGRPRPGAALAMAKRQNVSIVAGQGKKVTFD